MGLDQQGQERDLEFRGRLEGGLCRPVSPRFGERPDDHAEDA